MQLLFLKTSPKRKEVRVILNIISRKTSTFMQRPSLHPRLPTTDGNICNQKEASTILHYHTLHITALFCPISSHCPFLTTEAHGLTEGVEVCHEHSLMFLSHLRLFQSYAYSALENRKCFGTNRKLLNGSGYIL